MQPVRPSRAYENGRPRGHDFVAVQAGADRVRAGDGDDETKVFGHDGSADRIGCGAGVDRVVYFHALDPDDVVDDDCESVTVEE